MILNLEKFPAAHTLGCDVSHHNGNINFSTLFTRGFRFVYLKATEGVGYQDPCFQRSRRLAAQAGLIVGTYHFFHPGQDVGDQVTNFLHTIGKVEVGELPPALDWEITNHVTVDTQKSRALAWLKQVEAVAGMKPLLYSYVDFLKELGDLSQFKDYGLWLAHYGVAYPTIPKPWRDYVIWQTNDKNNLDVDLFNGDVSQLKALVKLA